MPRRRRVIKREVMPDPIYGSVLITKFVNGLLSHGKKSVAEHIFYKAMERIQEKTGKKAVDILEKAMKNVCPLVEVKSRRVGGATYQVPIEVRPERRQALGIRWLIDYASSRSGGNMSFKLGEELMAAANGEGSSVKKREDTHKMAEANKAFAHFRW